MRVLLMAAVALAAVPVAAADKPAKPPKEKLICHSSQATGTRFAPPPVCRTAADWEKIRQEQQADLDQRSRNGLDGRRGM